MSCFSAYGIGGVDHLALVPVFVVTEILLLTAFFGYHRKRTAWAVVLWALLSWPLITAMALEPCRLEKAVAALMDGIALHDAGMAALHWCWQFAMLTLIKITLICACGARQKKCGLWLPTLTVGIASHLLLAAWLLVAWMGG